MILPKLQGRGLFVFSDPGGAKSVLAMVVEQKEQLSEFVIISDRRYSFYRDFGLPIIEPVGSIKSFLQIKNFDFIYTGTSYTSTLELRFIDAAKALGIKSMSFIDHWTSFRKRFYLNENYIYPDIVYVIDTKARDIAVSEGIPDSIIKIQDNPYYHFLKKWKPSISKAQLFIKLQITDVNKPLIVFAPEPLSNINGVNSYGFDELIVTRLLNEEIIANKLDCTFLLKPHPNQNMEKLSQIVMDKFITADPQDDSNTIMYYADMIIGFFSNFLIEASMMNKEIFRLHIDPIANDPLRDQGIGKVVDLKELVGELLKNIKAQ